MDQKQLEQYIKIAEQYFGRKFQIQITTGDVYYMELGGPIYLSRNIFNVSEALAQRELYHEVGHYVFAPRRPAVALLWEIIAQKAGIFYFQDFCNIAGDMLVEFAMAHTPVPWQQAYFKGMAEQMEEIRKIYSKFPPEGRILAEFDNMLLKQFGYTITLPETDETKIAQQAYQIISSNVEETEKVKLLADLLKNYFKFPLQYHTTWNMPAVQSKTNPSEEVTVPFVRTYDPLPIQSIEQDDEEKLEKEIAGNFDAVADLVRLKHPKLYKKYMLLQAFQHILPLTSKFGKRSKLELPLMIWNVNDPVNKLNVIQTIQHFGATIIPGITTMKNTETDITDNSHPSKAGNILLILDISGSMRGEKITRAIELAITLIEMAKHYGDHFALIGKRKNYEINIPPGAKYDKAIQKLLELEGDEVNDKKYVFETAINYSKTFKQQLTVIFTDNKPPDTFVSDGDLYAEPDTRPYLQRLAQAGPLIIILFEKNELDNVKTIINQMNNKKIHLKVIEDPEKPLTEEIIKSLFDIRGGAK